MRNQIKRNGKITESHSGFMKNEIIIQYGYSNGPWSVLFIIPSKELNVLLLIPNILCTAHEQKSTEFRL